MTMTQQNNTGLFSDLGISQNFLAILEKKGFTTPTPIQHQVIPAAIEGKDIIGIAQTGTGKTLAFGIPMIQRLASQKGQGLILVPTRELAEQVEVALHAVGNSLGLKTAVIIGGTSQYGQVKALQRNPHIVIATPGRLMDLLEQGHFSLDNLSVIALDEADRMLDMGFLPQIKQILQGAPQERQTLLFSATMPNSISGVASRFMKIPLRIEVAPQGTSAKNVEQEVFVVRKNDKMRLLESVLTTSEDKSILIFSRTKHGAKRMARDIRAMGFTSTEIHSNKSQAQRKAALAGFTTGKFRIMVATDIAARGIDVKTISLVINFDLPDSSDDYVHRIGRTGRAGRSGKAISFMCPSEKADMRKIERLMKKSIPVLSLPELPPQRERSAEDKEDMHAGRGQRPSFNRNSSRGGFKGRPSFGGNRKRSSNTETSSSREDGNGYAPRENRSRSFDKPQRSSSPRPFASVKRESGNEYTQRENRGRSFERPERSQSSEYGDKKVRSPFGAVKAVHAAPKREGGQSAFASRDRNSGSTDRGARDFSPRNGNRRGTASAGGPRKGSSSSRRPNQRRTYAK